MAVPQVGDLSLAKYLKIVSKGLVYNNLSENSVIWTKIKQKKSGDAEGRELRMSLRTGYGDAAVDFMPVNSGSYPSGDKSSLEEMVALYKDYGLTMEVERTLIQKAISDMSRYGEPLAEEIKAKTTALSRLLSASAFGDGTGVIGEVLSAAVSSGDVVITLKSTAAALGFVGWFAQQSKYVAYSKAGVEVQPDTATAYDYLKVVDLDRVANTVTLRAINTSGATITQTTVANFVAGTVFYRRSRRTNGFIQDITGLGTTTDYNTVSEWWVGLDGLTANDGRKVNGLNLSGALKGTRLDAGGAAIDNIHFQRLMSQIMMAVGQNRYKYKDAMMAWETYDAMIESREADRRFVQVDDDKRGVKSLGFIHTSNTVMFTPDEFCQKQRIFVVPEGDVLQFHGRDFEWVNPNGSGQNFILRPNGTGHDRVIRGYMEGSGVLTSVHHAAIGAITNFTV